MKKIKISENFQPNIIDVESLVDEDVMSLPKFSLKFIEIIGNIFEKIYGDLMRELPEDYNPIIIGYDHDGINALNYNINLVKQYPHATIALETNPMAPKWISYLLRDEKEFKAKGTMEGEIPSPQRMEELQKYRTEVERDHGQGLLLWLMENNRNVVSIEHDDVTKWIKEDKNDDNLRKRSESMGMSWNRLSAWYTAIRRDLYGLKVLLASKPDIICTGFYHAIKYDLILNRNGERSFYLLDQISFSSLRHSDFGKIWKIAHNLYLEEHP